MKPHYRIIETNKNYYVEELYNEEEVYQELVKQLEEINIDELFMNTKSFRASNNNIVGNN